MSAVNRGLRQASRTLRLQQRFSQKSALTPLSARCSQLSAGSALTRASSRTNNFSTMASLQSNAPAAAPVDLKSYDPEIVDIADYVHNKPIDSDLAVSIPLSSYPAWLPGPRLTVHLPHPTVRHSTMGLYRHTRLWSRGFEVPGVHQAPRSHRRGHRSTQRHQGARNPLPARPRQWCLQHRCHDQVANGRLAAVFPKSCLNFSW